MPRIVITQPESGTYPGTPFSFKRGDDIEAPAGLISAIGANARNCTAGAGRVSPRRDDTGEPFGVASSSAWTAPVKDGLAPLWPYLSGG